MLLKIGYYLLHVLWYPDILLYCFQMYQFRKSLNVSLNGSITNVPQLFSNDSFRFPQSKPEMIVLNMIAPCYSRKLACHICVFCFAPRPVLVFGYCRCLRLCVRVCVFLCVSITIAHHLFKLESSNLDQKCKSPCLRSQLFFGCYRPSGWI